MRFSAKTVNGVYMKLNKRILVLLGGAAFAFCLAGCKIPFALNSNESETSSISYIAFNQSASTTGEIISLIQTALDNNEDSLEIFVTDESLINAEDWLSSLSGLEQLSCEYRRVKNGYNLVITFTRWDNYKIVNAYRSNNTSELNERQLALYNKYLNILDNVTSKSNSDYENELAIHDYLVNNIEYVDDGNDNSFNAYSALIEGKAVCSGYTEAFKTLLDMLGINNYTISGVAGNQSHIWNVVELDNEWYQVDVTWDDPVNSSTNYVQHNYFNITSKDMALDHTWDKQKSNHPDATGTKYSYANASKLKKITSQTDLTNYLVSKIRSEADIVEFTSTADLNIKDAIQKAGVYLTYSYKDVERSDYTLYVIVFNYD
jgi:hypothetical protein